LIILLAHRLVNHFPDPGRSEVLRRPKGDAFRTQRRPGSGEFLKHRGRHRKVRASIA